MEVSEEVIQENHKRIFQDKVFQLTSYVVIYTLCVVKFLGETNKSWRGPTGITMLLKSHKHNISRSESFSGFTISVSVCQHGKDCYNLLYFVMHI